MQTKRKTMVEHPITEPNASLAMVTKGGLEAITRTLAMEYAKQGIPYNAVAYASTDAPAPSQILRKG